VLGNNLRTRETIIYGESEGKTFHEIIEAASTRGWHSFDQCLLKAREADLVTDAIVLAYCTNKGKTGQALELLRKRGGVGEMPSPSGLRLDIIAPIKLRGGVGDASQALTKAEVN
jgi:hypothetical protein